LGTRHGGERDVGMAQLKRARHEPLHGGAPAPDGRLRSFRPGIVRTTQIIRGSLGLARTVVAGLCCASTRRS
jgi:hypothetical protein